MQIHAIHIDHFLSFDTFTWEGLDPHLNVIVGPNGAGKTNLIHALRAVRDTLNLERAQATARWAGTGHRGKDADTSTIRLDIEFTTAKEKQLLCLFLAAVLCDQQKIQEAVVSTAQHNLDEHRMRRFAVWVQDHLHPKNMSWLFRGQLIVTRAGGAGWQCQYQASPDAPRFSINLTSWETLVGNAKHNDQTGAQNSGPLFGAWRNSLTEDERLRLDSGLTGTAPEADFPVPDFTHLPDWVSSRSGVGMQVGNSQQYVDLETLATHRAFAAAVHPSPQEQRGGFGMGFVFQRLLEQALVFTDNVRLLPQSTFTSYELLKQPLDLSSGKDLACFLFRKKNGGTNDREQYADVQTLFSQMTTGRQFDVVLEPVASSEFQQGQPNNLLRLVTSSRWGDIPMEYSGAGIAEALFLSAVLAGNIGQVILLDEPALNLHPTMQTALLQHLQQHTENQFLMITHSPALIPHAGIEQVSRFLIHQGITSRAALDLHEVRDQELARLKQELRDSSDARALLFMKGVILVEGGTEVGALPIWFEKHFRYVLASQDITLYSVGTDTNFKTLTRLLHQFEVPWAILCDGPVIGDQQPSRIVVQLQEAGVDTLPDPSISDFSMLCQALEPCGIFTLARTKDDEFENLPIIQLYWEEAGKAFGRSKIRKGRHIAEKTECPDEVSGVLQRILNYLDVANR